MANEILPFGLGAESNVMAQADYDALAARSGGFSSGVAKSEQLNKVWRQSAFVASVLAQFIANRSAHDVLDDGDTATLLTNLELAIRTYANASLPAASTTIAGITQLSSLTNSNSEVLAATPKAIKAVSDATLKIASNLAEIASAGPVAIAATLANLTLKGAALRDVGTGANQIPDMNSFGVSFGASGYQKLPGGLIIQWGRVTTTSALIGAQWNFPITFPNAVLSYFAMTENSSGDSKYSNIGPISAANRTGATVSSTYPGAASNSCFAIGY
ncbi:gp53-like domain-containing protein [Yersinia rohdei]|uniref:gp53-like domain-containing protein n=1 Tax=Yersinia rohdei TaxID=29485 RepID=UPI0011A5B3F6|nr:phage tail protein [Yersinia rohdei]